MDPNQSTGSFGAAIGGAEPIKAAMARRGVDMGATSQSSITPNPIPAPVPQNTSSGGTSVPQTGLNGAPVSGLPPQTSEAELIIRALDSRLKSLSKLSEAQTIPPKPPTPTAV